MPDSDSHAALCCSVGRSAQCRQMPDEPGIVTDRPDVTESSIVVPKGSVQFENGITWTKQRHDNAIDFSETLGDLDY
jgi:hypothetical protein